MFKSAYCFIILSLFFLFGCSRNGGGGDVLISLNKPTSVITAPPSGGGSGSISPPGAATLIFCSSPTVSVSDNTLPFSAFIDVANGPPSLTDLNISIDLPHNATGELDIFLISPTGTSIALTTGNGGNNENFYHPIFFDDSASASVTTLSGANATLSPEEALSTFNGENPNGTWELQIVDNSPRNTGHLLNWCLVLNNFSFTPPTTLASFSSNGQRTFFGLGVSGIPNTITDTIAVSGVSTPISEIQVRVDVRHTFSAALEITLASPDSASADPINLQNFGFSNPAAVDDLGLIFRDDGAVSINTFGGSPTNPDPFPVFAPVDPLSTFNGENANGNWTLQISDNYSTNFMGILNEWAIAFNGAPLLPRPSPASTPPMTSSNIAGGGTFSSGLVDLNFSSLAGVPTQAISEINVSNGPALITEVRVLVDISHSFTRKLGIILDSPDPLSAPLILHFPGTTAGSPQTDMGVIFDDTFPSIVFFPGTPTNPSPFPSFSTGAPGLAFFSGENANGTWTLTVDEGTTTAAVFPYGVVGKLNAWAIAFNGDTSQF